MNLKNLFLTSSLLCLVAFMGCKKDDSTSYEQGDYSKRTVLMYLFQDTSLAPDLTQNINQVEQGWNPMLNGTILVYIDPSTTMTQFDGKPVLLEITHDTTDLIVSRIVKTYEDADATGTDVFRMVQEDAIEMYPAESYGLIIGGHANGFFVTNPSKGLYGSNRWGDNHLDIDVIAENVATHYDFMIFDACLMGESASLYQLRNATDFVVASPELVPGGGFAYDYTLSSLFTQPKADLPTFANTTIRYYQQTPEGIKDMEDDYVALGVYRMSAMEKLAAVTNKAMTALNLKYDNLQDEITKIIKKPEYKFGGSMRYPFSFKKISYYDDIALIQLMLISARETKLAKEFGDALNAVVMQKPFAVSDKFSKECPSYVNLAASLSFYIPNSKDKFQNEAFYNRFGWSAASGFTNKWE